MSNVTKAFIAVFALALLISGIVLSKNFGSGNLPIPNVSSLITGLQISSSKLSSFSSSSLTGLISTQVSSIVSKTMESSKVETPVVDRGSNPDPIQDIPNVTKLSTDKSIYWQYIRDYLACPTKFYQPLNGGFENNNSRDYKYFCISQTKIDECNSRKNKFRDGAYNGVYYCDVYSTQPGGPFLSELDFYSQYFPNVKIPSLIGYHAVPKYSIPENSLPTISFAAIPLESFSTEDQQYIAKNFNIK
jgi:hypothetical protein